MRNLKKIFLAELFSTCFFVGYFPFGPGSIASFIALAVFFFLPSFNLYVTSLLLTFMFLVGVYSSSVISKFFKDKDPKFVVIDEWVGIWFLLMFIEKTTLNYFFAFLIFRFFDICKVFPINKVEKLHGGIGIMLDDIFAAIYSLILLHIIKFLYCF